MQVIPIQTMIENQDQEKFTVTIGYRFVLQDHHTELTHGQAAFLYTPNRKDDSAAVYIPYRVHGTVVCYNRTHQSFSVLSPCMPHRSRINALMFHKGRVLVHKPTKFTGMKWKEFLETYGNFAAYIAKTFNDLQLKG